jgi:replication factor C subunit 1
MDDYYISKEDWDTIIELGVDEKKDDTVLKKISTATKTALTKKYVNFNVYTLCFKFAHGISSPKFRYNSSEHPIPFHKAQDLGKVPKKLAGGPAPDLEEAYVSLSDGPSAKESLMFTT